MNRIIGHCVSWMNGNNRATYYDMKLTNFTLPITIFRTWIRRWLDSVAATYFAWKWARSGSWAYISAQWHAFSFLLNCKRYMDSRVPYRCWAQKILWAAPAIQDENKRSMCAENQPRIDYKFTYKLLWANDEDISWVISSKWYQAYTLIMIYYTNNDAAIARQKMICVSSCIVTSRGVMSRVAFVFQ